ncbi:MAG: heavy metal translocating P-type ATPase [Microthrixaceae bacterium]
MSAEERALLVDDDDCDETNERGERIWESREVRWSALSGVLLIAGFLTAALDGPDVATALYVAATVAGARFFAREALEELVREREIGIELLMTDGALAAAGLGEWGEAAMLVFLYSISEALEEFTEARTEGAIRALMDLAPKTVTLLRNGEQIQTPAEDVVVGDRFLVRPGEGLATDGTIVDGASALDESAVTGESIPVEKTVGQKVFAGTLNGSGVLTVEATTTHENNTLAKIVHLVTEAQEEKGRAQRFMERFASRYSPAVLGVGVLVAVIGGLADDWDTWLERAATVVVAAAPCALVISIPITYVAAIGNAGRRGILVKGGVALEDLATVKVAAFDKTGTLTHGRPELTEILTAPDIDETEALALAAGVERASEHPLAKAVVDGAAERNVTPAEVTSITALVGAGIEGNHDGRRILVGSPKLIAERGLPLAVFGDRIAALESSGATAVVVVVDDLPQAVFGLADTLRDQARSTVQALKAAGIERTVMITGDNRRTADAIAQRVGVDEALAEQRPEDKAAAVRSLQDRYGGVVMAGDGINDAPALAAATVGVAMGSAGSDAALETADVALMADDLSKLADALYLARRTRSVVRQNLALSFAVLALLVPGALLGVLKLPVAVAGHELSELAVILSGLRMARTSGAPR